MTRMTGADCAVMCSLINTHTQTHTHTHTHLYRYHSAPFRPQDACFPLPTPYVRRRADMKESQTPLTTARSRVTARANPRRIMEFHKLFGNPSKEITRGTARMSDVPLTGTWSPCVQCSESRVRRYAVSKSAESRTNERAERFFIAITGPFH